MRTLCQCSAALFDKVCLKVKRATVFIDKACAEVLHWHGGLNLFLHAGALDVKEFSSFESADPTKGGFKAVFIVSTPLHDVTSRVIQDIVHSSQFQYVVVITAVSPFLHQVTGSGGQLSEREEAAVFHAFEDSLLQWMGNMNYTAEVEHIPLFTASISPGLFVTPAYSQMFTLLSSDLPRLNLQYSLSKGDNRNFSCLRDVEASNLPRSLLTRYRMLVDSINSMLENLGVQEDCFSVGPTSKILAAELSVYPPAKNRRKNAQGKASLILIDRSLDLCSVCNHQPDTLLDKILSVLPKLPDHNNDVAVDMKTLCQIHSDAVDVIVPGCLASSLIHSNQTQLQPLLGSRTKGVEKLQDVHKADGTFSYTHNDDIREFQQAIADTITQDIVEKEGLMEVNRLLVESASTEKLPLKLSGKPGRVTADQLESTLKLFKGKYKIIEKNIDVLQTAMATCHCLKSAKSKYMESLGSEEKLLLQSLGTDDAETPLSLLLNKMLLELAKPHAERSLTFDDLLTFLLYVYSMMGGDAVDSIEEEEDIKELLVKGVVNENEELSPLMKTLIGNTYTEEVVSAIVDDMFEKLKGVGRARENLKQLRSVAEPGTTLSPANTKPLLKQVIDLIFHPSKAELLDVEYKSSGFTELLKSGFGLFRTVAKPRPSDNPLLIVYVIGGITATEVKQIRDAVSSRQSDMQVLVGSTRLVTPGDIVEAVLCQDNLNLEGE